MIKCYHVLQSGALFIRHFIIDIIINFLVYLLLTVLNTATLQRSNTIPKYSLHNNGTHVEEKCDF